MARLIPKIDPKTISNTGERLVAQALLQQLPADYIVYHSYPWLRPRRHEKTQKDFLQPGEADFVVLHPRKGLLVLEIKGGEIKFQADTHQWIRTENGSGRQYEIQDPFVQAERNKYALRDRIQEHDLFRLSGPLNFTIGHSVIFPDCRYEGTLPAHVQDPILFSADDLAILSRKIDHAYDAWCPVNNQRAMPSIEFDAILEALSPVFRLTPVLWRTLDDQEERIKRLTDAQTRLLEMLQNQDRAAIEGVAGSGKTILAISQAQRFARSGKRTLFVCYNRPLADWLRNLLPNQYRDAIVIETYHQLCREMCRVARLPFPATSFNQDFWDYEAPELLEQAAQLVDDEQRFDAIVVDEGQDFRDFWWLTLEKLYRSDAVHGPLYIFYDPKQNIYVENPTIPADMGYPFVLPTNCRNTQRIAAHCAAIVGIEPAVHEDAPEGIEPHIVKVSGMKQVLHQTKQIMQGWCLRERGGLAYSRVAILTPTNVDKWPDAFGNIHLVQDYAEWQASAGVLLTTHRRFKGLEADAIILAGMPEPGTKPFYSVADYYVASSRAKHLLEIIMDS
ncbi:MAG: NERD domain-containing protein [Caldilineaceae bacterium]